MRNFLKFPCKVIIKVSLDQFAPFRSVVAVRRDWFFERGMWEKTSVLRALNRGEVW
jgi:hypothetical protein